MQLFSRSGREAGADHTASPLPPVLIVDDNPAKLTALVAALEWVPVDIVTVNSGTAALRQLLNRDFALVLLDVNMPILDGFATAALIRSRQRSEHLPILFISAERLTPDAQSQGYRLGAVDYLTSPVQPEILRAKVAIFADLYSQRLQSHQQAAELVRKNAEISRQNEVLEEKERLLAEIQRLAHMGPFSWEIASGRWSCGGELGRLLGLVTPVEPNPEGWAQRLHPDDRARVMASLRPEALSASEGLDLEFRILNPEEGKEHWVHLRGKLAFEGQAQPQRLVGTLQEISAHKRAEELVRQEALQSRQLFELNADGLLVINQEGKILLTNPAAGALLKRPPEDLVGEPFGIPITVGTRAQITLVAGGQEKTASMTSSRVTWLNQPCFLVSLRDISDRVRLEDQVLHLAYHDGLTQLPNLRLFYDRLDQAMARSARYGNYCALIFMDLDNFKPLNDTHGHAMGDLLLVELGRRLLESLRKTDTVARVGGDEFVLIITDLPAEPRAAAQDAQEVAEKIRSLLAEPYHLEQASGERPARQVEHVCPASLGVTLFKGREDPLDVVNRADAAMYLAKEAGGNGIHCLCPALDATDAPSGGATPP